MLIQKVAGSHFEIGQQLGEEYRSRGITFEPCADAEVLARQRAIYATHYPDFLDMLRGVAASVGVPEEAVVGSGIGGGIAAAACTIFGVTNEHGTFVGRNYDGNPLALQKFEVYELHPTGRYRFFGIGDQDTFTPDARVKNMHFSPDDAINEAGLYIGLTFAHHHEQTYGLHSTHLIQLIAETCATVEEALAVFARVPRAYAQNYVVADRSGRMVAVETIPSTFKIVEPKDGVLIQTNHFVDPELALVDQALVDVPTHDTFIRYYEVLQKVNAKKATFQQSDIFPILCQRGHCDCVVCDIHASEGPGFALQTLWSLEMDIMRGNYQLFWNVTHGERQHIHLAF